MAAERKNERLQEKKPARDRKKPIVEIGQQVPGNLKFGMIVAIATVWIQFVRSVLEEISSLAHITSPILADFVVASAATVIGYLALVSYRKIKARLRKVKV